MCAKGRKKSKGETPRLAKSLGESIVKEGETSKPMKTRENENANTNPSSGWSISVYKLNEPLQEALNAYNRHISPLTKIPKKL